MCTLYIQLPKKKIQTYLYKWNHKRDLFGNFQVFDEAEPGTFSFFALLCSRTGSFILNQLNGSSLITLISVWIDCCIWAIEPWHGMAWHGTLAHITEMVRHTTKRPSTQWFLLYKPYVIRIVVEKIQAYFENWNPCLLFCVCVHSCAYTIYIHVGSRERVRDGTSNFATRTHVSKRFCARIWWIGELISLPKR